MGKQLILDDAKAKFDMVRGTVDKVPKEVYDFAVFMVTNSGRNWFSPMDLIMSIADALDAFKSKKLPPDLESIEKTLTALQNLPDLLLIVDKIADKEFATEFRAIFNMIFKDSVMIVVVV